MLSFVGRCFPKTIGRKIDDVAKFLKKYEIHADDLLDVLSDASVTGKPMGQDLKNNRPSAVTEFGVDGAKKQLRDVLGGAIASIPSCPGEAQLAKMVQMQSTRMMAAHQTHPHA